MIPGLKDQPYEERLKMMGQSTLEEGENLGSMIAVFRAMGEIEKVYRGVPFRWGVGGTRDHHKK